MLLLIIRRWLDTNDYNYGSDVPRSDLVTWIEKEFPRENAELMADGLIAAGIGRDEEQQGTVCIHVAYVE